MHLTYRWPKAMFNYHTAALELALRHAERHPVVIDRWWPSEQVYAAALRGGSPWPMMGRLLDRVGLKHGMTYVLCLPRDKAAYLDHYQHTKSANEDVLGDRAKIYDGYVAWLARMFGRMDVMTYDVLTQGLYLNQHIDRAIHLSWRVKTSSNQVPFDDPWDRRFAGSPHGKHILIGDQSNAKTRREVWPFFEHGNSSLWITRKLEEAGIPEKDLAWANMHTPWGDRQLLREDLEAGWKFVALGNRAANGLKHTYVVRFMEDVIHLAHPQYYRRFNPNVNPFKGDEFTSAGEVYAQAGRDLYVA